MSPHFLKRTITDTPQHQSYRTWPLPKSVQRAFSAGQPSQQQGRQTGTQTEQQVSGLVTFSTVS